MKLRRLEIQGFKSFANRTILEFPDGVTAIVGPNGCGKSNIVDAIKWAMGEQSAKSLRGKGMNDVIFAGSLERPPAGMAEVSLIFEKSSNDPPPVPYLDVSEFKITRIMHRSGGSEYRIQNLSCRLKDIQDVLMGIGLGTKTYSIIEQGKISEFISSKPADRRILIEEAARITRFHTRRKESEKNLETSKFHLLRITDLLKHEENQIEKLKKQKRIYEKVKQLEKDLFALKKQKYVFNFIELSDVFNNTQQEIKSNQTIIKKLNEKLLVLKLELETSTLKKTEKQKEYEESFPKLTSLEKKLTQIEGEKKLTDFKLKEIIKKRNSYTAKLEELKNILKIKTNQLNVSLEKQSHISSILDIKTEDFEKMNIRWKTIRNDRTDLIEQLKELQNKYSRLEIQKVKIEEQFKSSERRKIELQNRIENTRNNLKERKNIKSKIENNLKEKEKFLKTLEEKTEKQKNIFNKIKVDFNKIKDLENNYRNNLIKIESELSGLKGRFEHFNKIIENREDLSEGERKLLQKIDKTDLKNKFSLLPDLIKPKKQYTKYISLFLDYKIEYAVTKDEKLAFQILEELANEGIGAGLWISFESSSKQSENFENFENAVPLKNLLEDINPTVEHFFDGYFFVENTNTALKLIKNPKVKGCITQSGVVILENGVIKTSHSDDSPFAIRSEIYELTKKIKVLENQKSEIQKQLLDLTQQFKNLKNTSEQTEQNILDNSQNILTIKTKINELKSQKQFEENSIISMQQQINTDLIEKQKIKDEKFEFDEENFNKIKVKLNKIKIEVDDKNEEFEEIQSELSDLRVDKEKWTSKQETEKNLSIHLKQEIEKIEDEIEKIRNSDVFNFDYEKDLKNKLKNLEKLQNELNEKLIIYKKEQSIILNDLNELNKKYEKQYEEYRLNKENFGKINNQIEIKLNNLKNITEKIEDLKKLVQEDFAFKIEELAKHFDENPIFTEQHEQELQKISKLIEKLKPEYSIRDVKLFEDALARFEHLSNQKDDLEKAIFSLEEAIKHITKSTEKYFIQAFDAIAKNFATLFPKLFGGGEAKLKLKGENILEAGIEIIARPPGKKLQSMELFSGGEKAMTAIAMLFSVFLYRPGPFCVLDEVDAPLDDSNVDKYNDLVRELSKRTQFLVITHNRHTMSKTDLVYGVTMEEPGCSKVVSMDLNEIQSKIHLV